MSVCCECCVLSGRGLCDPLITHPEESYPLWCVVVCDQETSRMRRPWPALGPQLHGWGNTHTYLMYIFPLRNLAELEDDLKRAETRSSSYVFKDKCLWSIIFCFFFLKPCLTKKHFTVNILFSFECMIIRRQ